MTAGGELTVGTIETAPCYSRDSFDVEVLRRMAHRVHRLVLELELDALVACGHSGLVLGGAAAAKAGVPIISVRKRDEVARHGGLTCAVLRKRAARWAFVDDLLDSGRTLFTACNAVDRDCLGGPTPAAVLLYSKRHQSDRTVGMALNAASYPDRHELLQERFLELAGFPMPSALLQVPVRWIDHTP